MDYHRMRDYADHLLAASGSEPWKLEITGDQIVMMMSPVGRHLGLVRSLRTQLEAQLPDTNPGYLADGDTDLEDVSLGVRRVPDLMVFQEDLLERDDPARPSDVLMVCEVVSRANPENDYEGKLRDYPAMGIPHYLIVDPRNGTVHAHSEPYAAPESPSYAAHRQYPFGKTVEIGPWRIDTSGFTRYGDSGTGNDPR
ncbi:Uma2 family endonuclease [Streptomyces sp. NPDC006465]|uniref:Uma2 family endonuclease n=1 Tax=Streptomyces sp. NPDC006465 TaxID=3157174 RepID=UPI0033A296EF